MNKKRPVPRLDLAPKLNRRLFGGNPFDYLRLLYWVFFFPQALVLYEDTFHDHRFGLQGVVLTVITPIALVIISQKMGFPIDRELIPYDILICFGIFMGLVFRMETGFEFGFVFVVVWVAVLIFAPGVGKFAFLGAAFGAYLGLYFSEYKIVDKNWNFWKELSSILSAILKAFPWFCCVLALLGLLLGMVSGIGSGMASDDGLWGVLRGMVLGAASGVLKGVLGGVVGWVKLCVPFGVTLCLACLRPESWLIGLVFNRSPLENCGWLWLHITPLPLPYLTSRLRNWLRQDWETGMHNANQLILYTNQDMPVIEAVNQELATLPPAEVTFRINQLADNPYKKQLMDAIKRSRI